MQQTTTGPIPVKFSGEKIKMGDSEYVIPPLSFGLLKGLQAQLKTVNSNSKTDALSDEYLSAMFDIICASISRNYPEITREELEDMIDLGNIRKLFLAVMGISGFEKKTETER